MPDIVVEMSVTWGNQHLTTTRTVENVAGDQGYRVVRESVRQAADTAARCFPDPQSPYSDALFNLAPNAQQGIVNAQSITPGRPDPENDPADARRD